MALAYATPLAQFALRRVKAGRRLGSRCNRRGLTSLSSKRIALNRLDRIDPRTGEWQDVLLENRQAGPAQIVQMRIDFANWLETLSSRNRRLAETLASGETTGFVARSFTMSAGRVSQLRRDLRDSWHRFVGELPDRRPTSIARA
jgi:hypothetical protein